MGNKKSKLQQSMAKHGLATQQGIMLIWMRARTHTHTHLYIYIYTIYTYIYIYNPNIDIDPCIHGCVCKMHACGYACLHVCMYVCIKLFFNQTISAQTIHQTADPTETCFCRFNFTMFHVTIFWRVKKNNMFSG